MILKMLFKKRIALFKDESKTVIVFFSFMPNNIFYESYFIIDYVLEKMIMIII